VQEGLTSLVLAVPEVVVLQPSAGVLHLEAAKALLSDSRAFPVDNMLAVHTVFSQLKRAFGGAGMLAEKIAAALISAKFPTRASPLDLVRMPMRSPVPPTAEAAAPYVDPGYQWCFGRQILLTPPRRHFS